MCKLRIITLSFLVGLVGCGGSSGSKEVDNAPPKQDPESEIIIPGPMTSVSLAGKKGVSADKRLLVNGQVVAERSVVNNSFSNATGSIRNSVGSATVVGNLTLGFTASDIDGIKDISFYLPNVSRWFTLCSNNCPENSLITVTGFNPQLAGETAGDLRIELIVSDQLDNQTLVDAVAINWQPIEISSISANRADGLITLDWSGSSSINRYNIYAATEPGINNENTLTLDNGEQILAYSGTSVQLNDLDEDKPYYILITGINSGGESGMGSPIMVPSNTVPINLPPIASADSYQMAEDEVLVGNVLDNDNDPEGAELVAQEIVTQPSSGAISLQTSGQFTYTPSANFFGTDSFSYVVVDDLGQTSEALVSITVIPANDSPVALDDVYTLTENGNVILNAPGILGNDTDIDGDTLTVSESLIVEPEYGTAIVSSDGSLTYTANENFDISDSFEYQVEDGQGGVDVALVTILTNNGIVPPVARNDTYYTNEDITLVVSNIDTGILANDNDPNGLTFNLSEDLLVQPNHGQLSLSLDGTFTYVPDSNYAGSDQFQYQINNSADLTAQAVVTINVIAQPDAPIASDDNYQLVEDQTLTVDSDAGLLINDSDPDGGVITVNTNLVEQPLRGSVVLSADGSFLYSPSADFNGTDSFTYQITNQDALTSQARVTLTITSANDAPIAIDDFANTEQDTSVSIDVLANDTDVDGDVLSIQSANVDSGTVNIVSNELVYTPPANFSGIANISYVISDVEGLTSNANVSVAVSASGSGNTSPIANDDSYNIDEDAVLNASSVLANDNDADGDSLEVQTSPVSDVSHGSLTLSSNGTFSYQADSDYYGTDSFIYNVSDGQGGFAQASVSIQINSVNDDPVAQDDSATTTENTALNGSSVLSNDSDVDNDTLTVSSTPVSDVSNGSLALYSDGTYNYTPNTDYSGSDSFIYLVNDGQGGTAQALVSIVINSTNSAPVAVNDSYIIEENGNLQGSSVLANDSDPDGDTLSINRTPVIDVANGNLNIKADGSFVYAPTANFNGSDSFVYEITDPEGLSSQASVSIVTLSVNSPPIAVDDSYEVVNDGKRFRDNVLDNDSDPEGDHLDINETPIVDVSNGTLNHLQENGNFEYTPNEGFVGVDSFVYEVVERDGSGSAQATVTFTVVADDDDDDDDD